MPPRTRRLAAGPCTGAASAAYRWSCSVSVHLEPGRRRTGAGRALYGALSDRLAARGYRRALAGVALPDEASLGLHRALGFVDVGTYPLADLTGQEGPSCARC